MIEFLALVPWALVVLLPLVVRHRPRLAAYAMRSDPGAPLVSVIVPARNEALNIGLCLANLLGSRYSPFEIIVVDDQSLDGTGEVARALARRSGGELRVLDAEPLPPGWLGKPWACWQGYRAARGELLLFTDADTRHGEEVLGRAVTALETTGADLVSLLPRQLADSFWERVVQPQFWLLLALWYRDLAAVNRSRKPRRVLANGQFILVRRSAYEAVGGHEGVRGEVVEDVRLAQRFTEAGRSIHLAYAEPYIETRMYRSLGEIVEGWSKNLAMGARLMAAAWLAQLLPWLAAAALLGLWVAPPVALVASWLGGAGESLGRWGLWATLGSLAFWIVTHLRLGVRPRHALLYPIGAAVAALIFLRSALRGERVTWKGREYDLTAMHPESPRHLASRR